MMEGKAYKKICLFICVICVICGWWLPVPAMAQLPQCTVTGTIYKVDGSVDPDGSVTIMKVVKAGAIITARAMPPIHANASGVVSFTVPRASTAYVYGNSPGLNSSNAGTALAIPDAATATLESLISVASVPSTGSTVKDEGTALANLVGTFNFAGAGVTASQSSAGVALITIPGDAVASVFGRTGAVVAAPNDYSWAQIDKTTSSLANLATRNYSDLQGTPSTFAPAAHAGSHGSAGADAITIAESQVTNLTTDLAGKQASLGFTAENTANRRTSFQVTPDDSHYASEKLVKDSLDLKLAPNGSGASLSGITAAQVSALPLAGGGLTGAVSFPTGTVSFPAISIGDLNTGIYSGGGSDLRIGVGGAIHSWFRPGPARLVVYQLAFTPGIEDTYVVRGGVANLQLGAGTGSGAAVAQTFSVQGSSGNSAAAALWTLAGSDQSGTTTTGGGVKIRGGNGTSAGGPVEIWTSAIATPAVAVSVAADKGVTLSSHLFLSTGNAVRLTSVAGTPQIYSGGTDIQLNITAGSKVHTTGGLAVDGASTFGAGTSIKNIRHGITSALSSGVLTVTDTGATANTRYFFTAHALGTVSIPSTYYVSARSAGASFTVTASVLTDTSTLDWLAVEP